MSQGYLSLISRSATSQEVQRFFKQHGVSWNRVNIYKGRGITEASLELYDSALEVEFIKKLSPRSSVTNQAQDFIVSSITLLNHSDLGNQKIGQIIGPLRLTSRFVDVTRAFGEHYEQNRHQGTYCWRKDGVVVEVDYETTKDQINYIVFSADNAEIKAIKDVADNFSDGALSEKETEQLGIEPPDLEYQDEPVPSEYDNIPVIERDTGSRLGSIVLIVLVGIALFFLEDIVQIIQSLV